MAAVAVEQMQQRAGEQEEERQIRVDVRPMLGDEKERRDEQEAPENPAAGRHSFTRRSRSALVTTENELSAIAAPAKMGESSRPNTG